jgi:hypothetical protein
MSISAWTGPVFAFGETPSDSTVSANRNPDAGPSQFYQGVATMDPRAAYIYAPGGSPSQKTVGWLMGGIIALDAAPAAAATANLAALQVPVASTAMTLASVAVTGVAVGVSITNATTGAAVTGLLRLDGAVAQTTFGDSGANNIWDPTSLCARAVSITSSGGDERGATFTVRGYDIYSVPMTETITGPNSNATANGKKAFKYIASVTPAGTVSGSTVSVGTTSIFGLPIRVDRYGYVRLIWNDIRQAVAQLTVADTATATATTGDTRGTYTVTGAAADGTVRLQAMINIQVSNASSIAGMFGVTQF